MAETIKGLNIKLGLDTTELDHNLKAITTELKDQQRDLKAINNALKYDSSNVNLWKDKQDKLNQILETTKKKLESQNEKLEEAKQAVKIGAISEGEFNSLKRSIQYTEADLNKLNGELEKTKDKIKSLGSIDLEKLNKVGSNLTKYVTAPILGAVSALGVLSVKSANTADEIADNASKVYLTVEAYQKWSYAAKILAVDEEVMRKSFVKINALLGDIASGNGEKYVESLNKMGLSTKDLVGLNSDQAFDVIRNALSKLEDETLRVAIANEIFGDKIGSELAQLISATTNEVESLKDEAEELGIITTEQAQIAGDFNDSLDKLKMSAQSLSVSFATTLLPVMQKIVDTMQQKMIPALRGVINWWANLSDGTKKIIAVILGLLVALGPVLVIVTKLIGLFTKLKAAFGALKIGSLLGGLALGKVAIVGLVAALAVLLLKNEKFQELLKKIFDALSKILVPIGELVSSLISKLMPVIETIMNALNKIIDALVEVLDEILDPLIEIINVVVSVLEMLIGVVLELLDAVLPPLIEIIKMIVDIVIAFMPIIKTIINLIGEVLSKVLTALMRIIEPIKKVLEVIIKVITVLIDIIVKLVESVIKPLNKVLEVVASLFEVIADIILVLVDVLMAVLMPILEIVMAILEPIIELVMIIIEAIAGLMEILMPLIDMLLAPLIEQLDFIKYLLEIFSPLLTIIGDVIGAVLAPALQLLMTVLEPILWVLEKIINAIKWIMENIGKVFEKVGGVFKKVGNFFGDLFTGKLFQSNSNSSNTSYTTNNVTVNTTSQTIDVNALNKALGGSYI